MQSAHTGARACPVACLHGAGEDRHRDPSVLRVQLGFLLPPSLPSPGNVRAPSAGLTADSSPRHPGLARRSASRTSHPEGIPRAPPAGTVLGGPARPRALPAHLLRKPRPRRPDEGEQHGLAPCGGGSGMGYFAASQKNAQPRPGVIRAGEQLLVLATWAPLPETYWHRSHRLPSRQPGPPPGTLSWGSTARNPGSMHDLPLSDPRPDGRPA